MKVQILLFWMLKNQRSIDSNNLVYKNNNILISGMSNRAASNLNNKELLFPSIYNIIKDYHQFPSISSIYEKQAAFNLIPGRQSKYKLTIPLYNNITLVNLLLISLNKKNYKNNLITRNYGLRKFFYGANIQFNIISPFNASYYLLP